MLRKTRLNAIIISAALMLPTGVALASGANAAIQPTAALATAADSAVSAMLPTANKTMYTGVNAKVRKSPSTNAAAVKTLPKGTKVTVIKQQKGWSQINSPAKGWIRNDLLTSKKPGKVDYTKWSHKQLNKLCGEDTPNWVWGPRITAAEMQTGGLCCPLGPYFYTKAEVRAGKAYCD
jgi:uncharacterized protein YgiM (DUF1202 family)